MTHQLVCHRLNQKSKIDFLKQKLPKASGVFLRLYLMRSGFRKQIDNQNSGNNQNHANDGRQIRNLFEGKNAYNRNQDDS